MSEYDPAAAFDMVDEGYQNGDDQYTPQQDVADEDDDYDPSSFNADDSAEAANTTDLQMEDATPLDAPKPKTVGGFIVDDEDEEEDAVPPPSQLNGTEGAQSGLGAAAVAQAQDVPVASEPSQDTAAQSAGFNGPAQPSVVSASHTPSNVSTTNFSFQPPALPSRVASEEQQGKQELQSSTAAAQASQSVTATPQPQTTAAPAPPPQTNGSVPATPTTQRLPHDKVGQLEDRIKDDPRADTDAWMTLISHYREKGQLDQVRSVYERFFKVFPDAVRPSSSSIYTQSTQLS